MYVCVYVCACLIQLLLMMPLTSGLASIYGLIPKVNAVDNDDDDDDGEEERGGA